MKSILSLFTFIFILVNTASAQEKVFKTNAEWKKILTPEQYYILREKGTERAFSGKLNKFYKKGTYYCAACKTPLFTSKSKFNSGTGWPSFDKHINNNVSLQIDNTYGVRRTEIICNTCNSHLGHLFNDGPKNTTGKRYCVNSLALFFKKTPHININQ